jgi:hypothetical protein
MKSGIFNGFREKWGAIQSGSGMALSPSGLNAPGETNKKQLFH